MLHLHQLAATHSYRYPVEQTEREHVARKQRMAREARRAQPAAVVTSAPRRSWVPRIAGALGIF